MLCRLTGWGTSFPLSAEDYVYPETGTDRPNLPIVATTFARNIVLINSISSFENISFLHRYIRAYIHPFHCSIASQSSCLLVDIATIELTISFCTPGFGKLSNTLMPLSSLAAGPARITIPNEPARGESNFFQPFSLSFFPPSRICPRSANLSLSFLRRPRRRWPAISFPPEGAVKAK